MSAWYHCFMKTGQNVILQRSYGEHAKLNKISSLIEITLRHSFVSFVIHCQRCMPKFYLNGVCLDFVAL